MKRFLFSALLLLISLAAFSQEPPVVEPQIDSLLERPEAVSVPPKFMRGGSDRFSNWVTRHLVYPKDAKDDRIEGIVYLSFTVDVDGSVKDVKVIKGVCESLDAEAVRVVSSSPKWECGTIDGKPVAVTYTHPIYFLLTR